MGTLSSELAPHVGRLISQPRVYADANVPAGVVAYMRERLGWDVLAVVEDEGLRRASDLEHYRTAQQLHRTVITLDDDFADERRFPPHLNPGVVVLSAPDEAGFVRLLRRIAKVYFRSRGPRGRSMALPLAGQTIQVHPDWDPTPASRRRSRRRRSGNSRRITVTGA